MSQFRDNQALHPSEGVRFLFERQAVDAESGQATYRVAVFTPDTRYDYRAEMQLDGSFALAAQGPTVSDDIAAKLMAQAKLLARGAKKKRARELPPWPHRVLRWRGPGR